MFTRGYSKRYVLLFILIGLFVLPSMAVAGYDLNRLAQAASAHGWSTGWASDGSLMLSRQARMHETQVAMHSAPKPASVDRLAAIQARLAKAGWQVNRDHDGSLIVRTKPRYVAPASIPETPAPSVAASKQRDHWTGLERRLTAVGWNVSRDYDGSLLLVPTKGRHVAKAAIRHAAPAPNMRRLAVVLRQRGWNTSFDARGDLLLFLG